MLNHSFVYILNLICKFDYCLTVSLLLRAELSVGRNAQLRSSANKIFCTANLNCVSQFSTRCGDFSARSTRRKLIIKDVRLLSRYDCPRRIACIVADCNRA